MTILNSIYNLLYSDTAFAGGFWGALFAFIFFLFGERLKLINKIIVDDRKEHIYLERYFNEVNIAVFYNKEILSQIIKDYKNNDTNLADFIQMPIRESAITKTNDYIFVNRMALHLAQIRLLNANLENINKLKNKINKDLSNTSEEVVINAKKSLEKLLDQLGELEKIFNFNSEMINNLTAENKIIIRKFWSIDFLKCSEEDFLKRNKKVEKEKIRLKENRGRDPIVADYNSKMREFGIKVDID